MNGIILIDKPAGKTSHDMVYFIRRLTGIKKVGHTGTLDPDATGVLPVCIGKATKVCDILTLSDKEYIAGLNFGRATDTQDASGKVLSVSDCSFTFAQAELAIKSFIGEIEQIPPMFSAIKKDGKKLYELARKGIIVEREPRKVRINDIEILELDVENKSAKIRVNCSKGTYIRTLCDDIGKKIGCGAYMSSLRRTKSGGFDICNCYTTDKLEELKSCGQISKAIIPTDSVFLEYESIMLDDFLSAKLKNGVRIRKNGISNGHHYRIYDAEGEFLAISKAESNELVLVKSFWS